MIHGTRALYLIVADRQAAEHRWADEERRRMQARPDAEPLPEPEPTRARMGGLLRLFRPGRPIGA